MNFILEQLSVFLATMVMGCLMGVIFDAYRVYFHFVKVKRLVTYLGDFLLWVFLALLTFALLLFCNWGEIRGYIFLGLALGLSLYLKYLNRPVLFFWHRFYQIYFQVRRRLSRLSTGLEQRLFKTLGRIRKDR